MSQHRPEIFISATTADLGPARRVVKDALLSLGCHPVEQSHFPPDYREIRDILVSCLEDCDAMIHLVGKVYGAEPVERPDGQPRRSYTQIEYDVARELGKPIYVFIAGDDFPFPDYREEDEEKRRLQEAHRNKLIGGNQLYTRFTSDEELHEGALRLRTRVEQLEKTVARDRRNFGTVAALVLMGLAVVGGGVWIAVDKLGEQGEAVQRIGESTERIEARMDKERTLLAKVLREATEKNAAYESLSPEQRFEIAVDTVAAEQGLDSGDLLAMINLFVVTVEADTEADPLDLAMAAMARQQFAEAAQLSHLAGEEAESDLRAAKLVMAKATAVESKSRSRAIEAYSLEAQSYFAIVEYDKSLAAFRKAASFADIEADPVEWAGANEDVGRILLNLAAYDESIPLLRRVAAVRERELGPSDPDLADALTFLGRSLHGSGAVDEAEPLLRRALSIMEAAHGPDHYETSVALNNLSIVLQDMDRIDEAEPLIRRALAIDEAVLGTEHPDTSIAMNNLALLLHSTDRLDEAEPLFRRALDIDRKTYPENHPNLAIALVNLARLLGETGRADEAGKLYREAIDINEKSLGPDHPTTAHTVYDLAVMLEDSGHFEAAAALHRRVLAMNLSNLGPTHAYTSILLYHLAETFAATGRGEEAIGLYRAVLEIDEATLGPDASDIAVTIDALVETMSATGQQDLALSLARRASGKPASEMLDEALGAAPPLTDLLGAIDQKSRELGKNQIHFLPIDQPVAPLLAGLPGATE